MLVLRLGMYILRLLDRTPNTFRWNGRSSAVVKAGRCNHYYRDLVPAAALLFQHSELRHYLL